MNGAYVVRFTATTACFGGVRFGAVTSLDGAQHDALIALLYLAARAGAVRAFDVAPVVTLEPVAIDAAGRAVPLERVLPANELWALLEAVLSE